MSFDIFVIRTMGSITPYIALRIWITDIKWVIWCATLIARTICGRTSVTVDNREKDTIHEHSSSSSSLWESQNREMIVRIYNIVPQMANPKIRILILCSTCGSLWWFFLVCNGPIKNEVECFRIDYKPEVASVLLVVHSPWSGIYISCSKKLIIYLISPKTFVYSK